MQVSVENTTELSRKMTVRISEDAIKEKMDARIKKLAREVKLDGFRPGKVPLQVVKKMYGGRVRDEITGDLIQSSYIEALQSEQLNPAGMPTINPAESENEEGFEYIAEFEVYPEIALDGLAQVSVNRANGEIEDADIDKTIESLRQQKKTWNEVDREAATDDQITIDFSGVCEDENFTDGKVEKYPLTLGAGQMIPGFEDQLIGLKAGESKVFEVAFPEDYNNEKLAGKTAEFSIDVVSVEEPELPEVNAEFVQEFGVEDGDLEVFREQVKANLNNELEQAIKRHTKNNVMDALYEKVTFTVPNVLIDQEIENLKEPYKANAKGQKLNIDDLDLPRDMFEEQARRRVALGLILAEIIQKNDIKADDARVRETLENMARSYESPDEMLKWYYGDKDRLAEIESLVLEDQAMDWVLTQVDVTEEVLSFDELSKPQQ